MISHQVLEYGIAATTLGVSAFVAYGPYRHRLPRFMTRFAKLGIVFKLGVMSAVSGLAAYHSVVNEGRLIVQVILGVLSVGLAAGAVGVALWAPARKPPESHGPHEPPKA